MGGPCHRDEGPPLLRRIRPDAGSTFRRNKLGSTEYGLKAIPLGGFCDIAGMTPVEDLRPEDEPYAMYKQKTWKRVAVLFAGPAMNFVIGLVLVYAIAIIWGLPTCIRRPPPLSVRPRASSLKSPKANWEVAPAPVRRRAPAFRPATSWSESAIPM